MLIPKGGAGVTEKGPVKKVVVVSGGRKLLQRGGGGGGERDTGFDFAQQASLTDTAGAISDAASGQSSAASATAAGTANAIASNPMYNDY